MHVFIRKLFQFTLGLVTLTAGVLFVSCLYMNSIRLTIDKSKNILVLGDSHTECAIDGDAFTRAENFSKSATPVIYSYVALRQLIVDNPQIDTVLLGFHTGTLIYERERNWIFGESEMARQIPYFLPYFNAEDVWLFLRTRQFYKSAMEIPRASLDYYLKNRNGKGQSWINENIGHFRQLTFSMFSKDTSVTIPFANQKKKDTVSQISLGYIRKMAIFCKEHHITLILINPPVYRSDLYDNYAILEENRKKLLRDLLFVNYENFPIPDSSRFDIWHLNQYGARQFSQYLASNLANDVREQNR